MTPTRTLLLAAAGLAVALPAAADWPQWRGPHRDARVADFAAPAAWPKTLTKKWSVPVGDGVATPALVGDKLYTFSRQGGDEVVRCLDAATGKEAWQDKYPAEAPNGPSAREFPGPRSSPAVAGGKVVTLGVRGTLSCLDAATGKEVWRKDDVKGWPNFFTSSSPVVVDGLCVVELGGERGGGVIAAYDLATGDRKWKTDSDGTAYASPVLLTADGVRMVVTETAGNVVGVAAADGKELWKAPFKVRYNACTPVVDGQTIIYSGSGKGTHALAVERTGGGFTTKDLWANRDVAVQFNTPVVKNGLVFGISDQDQLFCIDAGTGKTAWTAPLRKAGGGGRMGRGGYGSVVDAGAVLFALNPSGELLAFEPSAKEFKKVAAYQVADGSTYAYPVIDGKRVFIKDKDAVALWSFE